MVGESKLPFLLEESWPIIKIFNFIGLVRLKRAKDHEGHYYLQPMKSVPYLILWFFWLLIFCLPSILGFTFFCYGRHMGKCLNQFVSTVTETTTDAVACYLSWFCVWAMYLFMMICNYAATDVVSEYQDHLKYFDFALQKNKEEKEILMKKLKKSMHM
jgi:hypothetical protein